MLQGQFHSKLCLVRKSAENEIIEHMKLVIWTRIADVDAAQCTQKIIRFLMIHIYQKPRIK